MHLNFLPLFVLAYLNILHFFFLLVYQTLELHLLHHQIFHHALNRLYSFAAYFLLDYFLQKYLVVVLFLSICPVLQSFPLILALALLCFGVVFLTLLYFSRLLLVLVLKIDLFRLLYLFLVHLPQMSYHFLLIISLYYFLFLAMISV